MKATIEKLVSGKHSERICPWGLQVKETLDPKNGVHKRFPFLIALILSVILLSPDNSFSQLPPGDNTKSGGLEIIANDGDPLDFFGQSVAINNNWVVVDAYNDDINDSVGAGSAYVFHPGGIWPQHAKLTSSYNNARAGDHFGWSVSVSDNYAVVGAPWSLTYAVNSGVACIFRLDSMVQTEVIDMGQYYAEDGDEFGASVALDIANPYDGETVIVGAPGHSVGDKSSAGMACVFYRDFMLESWSLQTRLTASDLEQGGRFGCSVDLYLEYDGWQEDENFIVGAKNHDIGNAMAAGAAYIYHHDLRLYQRVEIKLIAPDYHAEDYFGCAVSIHDNYAIVGAEGDDTYGDFSGAAYIFEREDIFDTTWAFVVKLTAGEYAQAGALFGSSVSISDDYAIVGAPNDDVSATNSGAAYLFYRSGSTWSSSPTRVSESTNSDIRFGNSVSSDCDEDNFVVGAYLSDPNGNTNAGAAYIYSSTRGGVSGSVTVNGSGTPVSGAIVSIDAWSDTSDISGNFAIDNIIEGTFDVSCAAPGYAESIATDVVITGGSITNLNFSLNPIAEDALAIWHLDKGSGTTAFDATINKNDGIISGATWATGCDGPFGLLFDGYPDMVTVPHSNSLDITQPFSVEAMIKCTGQSHYYAIVDKYTYHPASGSEEGFTLYLSGGKLRFSMYCGSNGNIGAAGTTNLRDSVCHHVKASWDGDTIRMFVDGNLEGKVAWAHPPASTTANLGIGKRLSGHGGTMNFQGIIDEVIISNISEEPDPMDFGDAPDPSYPTLLANNGARHLIDGITYLGVSVDAEADGLSDPQALGDDNNNLADEDGVVFTSVLASGKQVCLEVTASAEGILNAWMDFNIDGDWDDTGEQIFVDENLTAGINPLSFAVPANALAGNTFARFRFSTLGELSYEGYAPDGEVEDYQVEIAGNVSSWFDGFEAYALNSDIVGQGGWEMWGGLSSSPTARITNVTSHSGSHSVKIRGKADQTGDDIVRQFSGCTTGVWELSAWQYIPSNAAGGTTYFILLNQYDCIGNNLNWSAQIKFDPDLNIVESDYDGATLALVKDLWVKISVVIDLDNDTQSIYYNGQLLVTKSWTEGMNSGGILNIAALNLFSNTLENVDVFYDDISIQPYVPSDIWVKDCLADDGTTPSNGNCPAWWTSHDIWIDNNSDGIQDAPVRGAANKLYVRPRNMGTGTANNVTVDMYYRNNTTGLFYPAGSPYIGSLTGLSIPSGGSTSGWVTWTVPYPPTTYGHYCIGAVLSATYDPQTNTCPVWDNNVCCLNMPDLYIRAGTPAKDDVEPTIADFLVRNPLEEPGQFVLDAEIELPAGWIIEFFDEDGLTINLPYEVLLEPGEEQWINMVVTPEPNAEHGETGLVVAMQYEGQNYPDPEAIIGGINFPVTVDLYKPAAINDLEVSLDDDMTLLEWTPVTFDIMGNDEKMACYNIYRGTSPGFEPDLENRVGRVAIDQDTLAPGFQWYDEETLRADYYYLVRAEDEAGYESNDSNLGFLPGTDMDFGDAPDPSYPTLLANNGARHLIDGITYLGVSVDAEADGLSDPQALGDDNNNLADEDGVVFTSVLAPGKQVCLEVTASADGILNAWMDFNIDGDWDDTGEQIFVDEGLTAGINPLSIAVPATALAGNTFARFRYNTAGGLSYEGYASDGEVEDYQLEIVGDVGSWTDGFEAYALNSDIVGQGGWEMWGALSSSPTARVTGDLSHSGDNSLKIRGKIDQTGDDIVHQFSGCTTGVWELSAWQYIPSNAAGGATYFILLNQYECDGSNYNWSTQIKFDPDLNIVESDFDGATLAMVTDYWVKISVVIDLDNNTQSIYYNGQLLVTKSWTEGMNSGGILNIAALNLFSNTLENVDVFYDDINLRPLTTQDLTIFEGWSGISISVNPVPQDVEDILAPISDKVVIIYNFNGAFWPGQSYNTLGDWDVSSGYIIKVNDDAFLGVSGTEITSNTVYLSQGWNLIPVYSQVDAMATLGSLPGFVIAKGITTTELLWPGIGIYTLSNLYPGKSYLVYMTQPGSFTYPAGKNKSSDMFTGTQTISTPWNDVHQSPSTHVVAFPETSLKLFSPGDVIGAFTRDGLCAGTTTVSSLDQPISLMLMGDDLTTENVDGFSPRETVTYRLYSNAHQKSIPLNVTYSNEFDDQGMFQVDGLSLVSALTLTGFDPARAGLSGFGISLYPNPSNGIFNIEGHDGQAEIRIFNALGNEVRRIEVNLPCQVNFSFQPKGIYFIRIISEKGTWYSKLIVE